MNPALDYAAHVAEGLDAPPPVALWLVWPWLPALLGLAIMAWWWEAVRR